MKQNKTIGVTGISGSGQSTVAEILAELGGFVIHADKLAHEVIKRGNPAYDEIVKLFGSDILDADGEINRRALGAKAFGNGSISKLESIIHPKVLELIHKMKDESDCDFTVIDAPLLVESGLVNDCDFCWLVYAPDEILIERICKRDKITPESAKKRISARKGYDHLRKYADTVIVNDGDLNNLKTAVKNAIIKTTGANE